MLSLVGITEDCSRADDCGACVDIGEGNEDGARERVYVYSGISDAGEDTGEKVEVDAGGPLYSLVHDTTCPFIVAVTISPTARSRKLFAWRRACGCRCASACLCTCSLSLRRALLTDASPGVYAANCSNLAGPRIWIETYNRSVNYLSVHFVQSVKQDRNSPPHSTGSNSPNRHTVDSCRLQ